MKKITSLALAALLAVSLSYAVSAEAVSTDIKNGTPVLDGELDEIYTQSASYKLDNFGFYAWGDGQRRQHLRRHRVLPLGQRLCLHMRCR